MRTTRIQPHQTRTSRRLLTVLAIGAMSQLTGCFLFNEFHTDAWAISDDCFTIFAGDLNVDFGTGQLTATGLSASVENLAHCKAIKKITITGWVDKNDNGTEDEGEAIESMEHEVAEEEGSNSVDMGDISLGLNAGGRDAADVNLRIDVERVGATNTQTYRKKIRKC